MLKEIRQAALFTVVTMVLFGGIYHAVVWGVGRLAFPAQAEGSLIRGSDGRPVGSRLVGQRFTRPEYFLPRPSAVDYNAAAAGASNDGPSNPAHLADVRRRLEAIERREQVAARQVPAEMVTASGSGLDPHIPPDAAALQAPRVARARAIAVDTVLALVRSHTEAPVLGFLGRARVNVLELNLALDAAFGPPPRPGP